MIYRSMLAATVAFVACGCSHEAAKTGEPAKGKPAAVPPIAGPKGKLSLGDSLEQAKRAFPLPHGAEAFNTSLNFAILGAQGWAWQASDNSQAFEVMLRDGKVAAVALTRFDKPEAAVAAVEREWGAPTHKSVGTSASAESWVFGDSATMAVVSDMPGLGKTGYVLMGSKSDLQALGYDADDPAAFVTRANASKAMAKVLEPVFREAKRRAMEKAGRHGP